MKVAGRLNFFIASTFIRFAEIEKAVEDRLPHLAGSGKDEWRTFSERREICEALILGSFRFRGGEYLRCSLHRNREADKSAFGS